MINNMELIQNLMEDQEKAMIRKGGIKTETKKLDSMDALISEISSFGGSGWLMSTGKKLTVIENGQAPPLEECRFIIRGELFDGEKTLQINRTGLFWTVATKSFDQTSGNLLETVEFRRQQAESSVCYEVEYDDVPMNGHSEIQPVNSRFIGWGRG